MVCPVCREPLTYDVDQLLSAPAPQLPEVEPPAPVLPEPREGSGRENRTLCSQVDEAAVSSGFRQRWSQLQQLLERQRSKGGIIDPEAESNRFLIHINQVRGGGARSPGGDVPAVKSLNEPNHFLFLVLVLVDALRRSPKTDAQMPRGRPAPPPPGPLTPLPSEWSSPPRDCPAVEAARPTGTSGEAAGPGRRTGEAPPSRRTCTSCVCLHSPPTHQRRPELRAATSSRRKRTADSARQSRTGVSLQSGGSFPLRCPQTAPLRSRQPLQEAP